MFNPAKPQKDETRALFDLSKYYKIWFSKNPDIFLGAENELRFIRMRANNPEATLHFIFSSNCLSGEAIDRLYKFCKEYNIIPIEFESIEKDLIHQQDRALYSFAKDEIQRAVEGTGGNMAAAADCTRIIAPIIENYGIYSDLDVESSLSKLGAQFVSLRGPLLFIAEMMQASTQTMSLTCNSDFLAFSLNDKDPECLSPEALCAVRNLQEEIIQNYANPLSWEKLSPSAKIKDLNRYPELEKVYNEFCRQYPENPSIFDFRTYLSTLPDLPAKPGQIEPIKSYLMRVSVIHMAGPGTYYSLFKDILPSGYTHVPLFVPFKEPKWQPYLKLYERCGVGFYDAIGDLIQSKNSALASIISAKSGKKERLSDQAWTEEGALAKRTRDERMENAASAIQGFWVHREFWKKSLVERSLFNAVKKICKDESLLSPIREEKYGLALRRACAGLKLPIVQLLLQYQQRGLAIDINESSATSESTAMDWALNATPNNTRGAATQKEIIELLRHEGARTAEEMKSLESNNSLMTN